jgi:single-stranded-DNA-specific exonuclease
MTEEPLFDRFGGHQAAAGFSLPTARLPELAERFERVARERLAPEQLEPVLTLDGYLRPETISYDFARALERLAPFGAGFPLPTFGVRGLRLVDSRTVGAEGQHWKLRLRPPRGFTLEGIYFGGGPLAAQVPLGSCLDAAFRLKRSQFEGEWRLELEVLDVAPVSSSPSNS